MSGETHEYVRFVVPPMTNNPLHSWKSDTNLYGGIYRSPFSTVLVEILDLLLSYALLGFQECFRVLCLWWIDPESWCRSLFCGGLMIVHHSGLIHIFLRQQRMDIHLLIMTYSLLHLQVFFLEDKGQYQYLEYLISKQCEYHFISHLVCSLGVHTLCRILPIIWLISFWHPK